MSTDSLRVQTATRVEMLQSLASGGLQPQHFVCQADAWPAVNASAFDAAQMIELARQVGELGPGPTLEKMWSEAIYEAVRRAVLPNAPSRLDCLYAVETGYDAFDILPELGLTTTTFGPTGGPISGPVVVPAHTRGRWVAVDMHLFHATPPIPTDEASVTAMRETTERLAMRYWAGEASTAPIVELLCDGLDVDGWAGYIDQ